MLIHPYRTKTYYQASLLPVTIRSFTGKVASSIITLVNRDHFFTVQLYSVGEVQFSVSSLIADKHDREYFVSKMRTKERRWVATSRCGEST